MQTHLRQIHQLPVRHGKHRQIGLRCVANIRQHGLPTGDQRMMTEQPLIHGLLNRRLIAGHANQPHGQLPLLPVQLIPGAVPSQRLPVIGHLQLRQSVAVPAQLQTRADGKERFGRHLQRNVGFISRPNDRQGSEQVTVSGHHASQRLRHPLLGQDRHGTVEFSPLLITEKLGKTVNKCSDLRPVMFHTVSHHQVLALETDKPAGRAPNQFDQRANHAVLQVAGHLVIELLNHGPVP